MNDLLSQGLDPANILLHQKPTTLLSCLSTAAHSFAGTAPLNPEEEQTLLDALERRENLGLTSVGEGIALPHAYLKEVPRGMLALLQLDTPLDLKTLDGKPVDLVVVLVGPERDTTLHLQTLAKLMRLFKDPHFLTDLRNAETPQAVITAMETVEARHA